MSIVSGNPIFVPPQNIDTLQHDILHDPTSGVSVYPTLLIDDNHHQDLIYEFSREEIYRSCQKCNMIIRVKYDSRDNAVTVFHASYLPGKSPIDYIPPGDKSCPPVEDPLPSSAAKLLIPSEKQ